MLIIGLFLSVNLFLLIGLLCPFFNTVKFNKIQQKKIKKELKTSFYKELYNIALVHNKQSKKNSLKKICLKKTLQFKILEKKFTINNILKKDNNKMEKNILYKYKNKKSKKKYKKSNKQKILKDTLILSTFGKIWMAIKSVKIYYFEELMDLFELKEIPKKHPMYLIATKENTKAETSFFTSTESTVRNTSKYQNNLNKSTFLDMPNYNYVKLMSFSKNPKINDFLQNKTHFRPIKNGQKLQIMQENSLLVGICPKIPQPKTKLPNVMPKQHQIIYKESYNMESYERNFTKYNFLQDDQHIYTESEIFIIDNEYAKYLKTMFDLSTSINQKLSYNIRLKRWVKPEERKIRLEKHQYKRENVELRYTYNKNRSEILILNLRQKNDNLANNSINNLELLEDIVGEGFFDDSDSEFTDLP